MRSSMVTLCAAEGSYALSKKVLVCPFGVPQLDVFHCDHSDARAREPVATVIGGASSRSHPILRSNHGDGVAHGEMEDQETHT